MARTFSSDKGMLYHFRRLYASTLLSKQRMLNRGSLGFFSLLVNFMKSFREAVEANVTKRPCLPPAMNSSIYNLNNASYRPDYILRTLLASSYELLNI